MKVSTENRSKYLLGIMYWIMKISFSNISLSIELFHVTCSSIFFESISKSYVEIKILSNLFEGFSPAIGKGSRDWVFHRNDGARLAPLEPGFDRSFCGVSDLIYVLIINSKSMIKMNRFQF